MRTLGRLVIVKATNGATDTILYSEHVIRIGSHNGQGEVDSYQTPQTHVVLSSICFGKHQVFDTGTNFLTFSSF